MYKFQPINQNLSTVDVSPALRDVLQQLINATISLQAAVTELASKMEASESSESIKLMGDSYGA